jgi:hypothetical protein
MNLDDSYKNPFSEYNANKMDSKTILEFWCSPFSFARSKPIESGSSEADVLSDQMPLFFVGGRGTGKTMLLKYFSYQVQLELAKREVSNGNAAALAEYFTKKQAIGIYIRIDGPLLRSFRGKAIPSATWDAIFAHFFELRVCQTILDVLRDLVENEVVAEASIDARFYAETAKLLGLDQSKHTDLTALLGAVEQDLTAVTAFRSDIVFKEVTFSPRKSFSSGDLFGLLKIIRKHVKVLGKNLLFPIFIDEYENFSIEQQRQINTLVKFVPEGATFRIGMRFEGLHTFDTVNPKEFIKKGRDYQEIIFEEVLIKDKDYEQFLVLVAAKRLEAVPAFRRIGATDIRKILGLRANLESEAKALLDQRKTANQHFKLLRFANFDGSAEKTEKLLKHSENPLLEMLNVLWVIRGKNPKDVKAAMDQYLSGSKTPQAKKYRMDYVDKYKLSLMFLLCSVYRKNKQYYSFNTFCFLSSGIVGNFIELCRRSFQLAYFEDRENLLNNGVISAGIQDTAAKETSSTELQMVTRIHEHGDALYRFVCNLGNIFRSYQTDAGLKYPETNQFSVDIGTFTDQSLKRAFQAAVEWSLIQRKPRLQRTSPSSPRRVIYTLNRIFAPAFEITYRTRGQFSEEYSEAEVKTLMSSEDVKPKVSLLGEEPPAERSEQLSFGEV